MKNTIEELYKSDDADNIKLGLKISIIGGKTFLEAVEDFLRIRSNYDKKLDSIKMENIFRKVFRTCDVAIFRFYRSKDEYSLSLSIGDPLCRDFFLAGFRVYLNNQGLAAVKCRAEPSNEFKNTLAEFYNLEKKK